MSFIMICDILVAFLDFSYEGHKSVYTNVKVLEYLMFVK